MNDNINIVYQQKLSDQQFERLADFLYNGYGLKMPPTKKIMMEGRLKNRLIASNFIDFDSYINFVFNEKGTNNELLHMVDVLTTNKTDFFRENHHFEFLKNHIIPCLNNNHHLKIWSAGCSSGEEPYSIAMTIEEAYSKSISSYTIVGTDLSYKILQKASRAIYPMDIEGLSLDRKRKFFLKSKDQTKPTIRVTKEVRRHVNFKRLNLMNVPYKVDGEFDIIFFRNVMIYFDRDTQQKVLSNLCSKLKIGGYLFIGHSESITTLDLPLKQIEPTTFIKI